MSSVISVEVAPGELIDKITILEIKKARMTDVAKLENVRIEWETLTNARDTHIKKSLEMEKLTASLKAVNEELWIIEDDKRLCEKEKNFTEKFIKLSRDVHFLNDDRAKIKLEINNHTGSKIKEIKEYTSY